METSSYFKKWIDDWEWGVRISIFIILLAAIIQFSLYALTQSYVVAIFGVQPEDISFSVQITYVTLLASLPLHSRLMRFFEPRNYILSAIIAGIILDYISLNVNDIYVFFTIRFLQGIAISAVTMSMLTMIFSRIQAEKRQAVGYSVFYGTTLCSSVLIGVPTAWINDNMDWKKIYYCVILIEVLALVIAFLVLRSGRITKKYPLFQIDWRSFLLLVTGMVSLTYFMIYGPRLYWFEDSRIITAFIIIVVFFTIFLFRQLQLKRPIVHLTVFKSRNFLIGIAFLALYYGLKDSINLVYSYLSVVVHWNTYQLIGLGFSNVFGVVLMMFIASHFITKPGYSIRFFIVTGFSFMLAFNYWMYNILTPDLSFEDLIIPMFLQGAASGMLFVPLAAFVLSSVPVAISTSAALIAANVRFFSSLNSTAGFYTMQLFYNQHYKEGFLAHITPYDMVYTDKIAQTARLYTAQGYTTTEAYALAQSSVMKLLTMQSQLLTSKTIFLIITSIVTIIVLLALLFPYLSRTYIRFNKRIFPRMKKSLRKT